MRGLIARVRSLWRGIRRDADVESEMAEEFRLHLELRTEDLVASGLSPAEAVRQARLEFGGVERYREEGRQSRGLHYFDEVRFSWLDVRLGARMLVKYPGLAVVGGLAMAVAIAIGATFDVIAGSFEAPLPFEEGERIVALENIDTKWNDQERRILHDFAAWRDGLTSVVDLGAFRLVERNLLAADRPPELVAVAGITASGFAMARVPPLLGRPLVAADERADASPAVVIGRAGTRVAAGPRPTATPAGPRANAPSWHEIAAFAQQVDRATRADLLRRRGNVYPPAGRRHPPKSLPPLN